jgi:hypothetical protein
MRNIFQEIGFSHVAFFADGEFILPEVEGSAVSDIFS